MAGTATAAPKVFPAISVPTAVLKNLNLSKLGTALADRPESEGNSAQTAEQKDLKNGIVPAVTKG